MPTHSNIRHEFEHRGLSISEWARSRGFSTALVYQVLTGKRKAVRGQSHQIAVALGLKEGIVADMSDLPFESGRKYSNTEASPNPNSEQTNTLEKEEKK